MSKVYIHNMSYGSRAEALAKWQLPKTELGRSSFWNVWKNHGVGSKIEDGTRILLIASWPEAGRMTHQVLWDATASNVSKWDGIEWDDAVRKLGRWTGVGVAAVREDPYMAAKKDVRSPLFVMAWRPNLVRWVDHALPDNVRLSRNGWAALDESVVNAWPFLKATKAAPSGKKERPEGKGGQGRRLDLESRLAVEARGMAAAKRWCTSRGWKDIENTSANKPWDYVAVDENGIQRFIEVKGTTGDAASFEVTAGEVKAARRHGTSHLLVAVVGIVLEADDSGRPIATGGKVLPFEPWAPLDAELTETRYTWAPAAHRNSTPNRPKD